MNTKQTPVVFRKYKSGEIIALFPATTNARGICWSCRNNVKPCPHITVYYREVIRKTKPATRAEYAELLQELIDRKPSEDLRVYKRAPRRKEAK